MVRVSSEIAIGFGLNLFIVVSSVTREGKRWRGVASALDAEAERLEMRLADLDDQFVRAERRLHRSGEEIRGSDAALGRRALHHDGRVDSVTQPWDVEGEPQGGIQGNRRVRTYRLERKGGESLLFLYIFSSYVRLNPN